MITTFRDSALILFLCFLSTTLFAEVADKSKNKTKSITLKHISGEDVLSVLGTLIDKSISISKDNNILLINGSTDKIKSILPIIEKIDTPPEPFTIEFVASNRKINFNQSPNTFNTSKSLSNTSQSLAIIERQWVTLNTGLTIPISERKKLPDGTETQSFRYKQVSKSYLFKVHEFSGWSVIQLGLSDESLSDDITGAIEYTKLDTTIIGKTGEWIEVASKKPLTENNNSNVYTTKKRNSNYIFLYVKVIKAEKQINIKK